jgi:hypothetical protein
MTTLRLNNLELTLLPSDFAKNWLAAPAAPAKQPSATNIAEIILPFITKKQSKRLSLFLYFSLRFSSHRPHRPIPLSLSLSYFVLNFFLWGVFFVEVK